MRTFFQDDTWQSGLEEIRVRVGQPIEFCYGSDNCYLTGKEKEQMFCSEKDYRRWEKDLYHATEADLREMLNYISNYSLYAYKEEIKQGYITIEGGHRVGVAGQTVLVDGKIAGISPITFLNIRIAHEKCGCAKKILPLIRQKNSIYNTLILSMPGPDEAARAAVEAREATLIKPRGALGRLETISAHIAAWQGKANPRISRPLNQETRRS